MQFVVTRYFGISASDSARSSVTKFSSASSLPKAVTMKTSFASQSLAFFTSSFWRWLSRLIRVDQALGAGRGFFRARGLASRSFPMNRRWSISRFTVRIESWLSCLLSYAFSSSRCISGVSALAMSIATPSGILPLIAASSSRSSPAFFRAM